MRKANNKLQTVYLAIRLLRGWGDYFKALTILDYVARLSMVYFMTLYLDARNGRTINGLETIWKETVVAYSRYYPCSCLGD
jgi:hypothetical protein